MAVKDTTTSWGWPARLIHWAMAAMILFLLGLGFWVSDFETDIARQIQLTFMHKSFGFTVFVLAVIRVVWRSLCILSRTPASRLRRCGGWPCWADRRMGCACQSPKPENWPISTRRLIFPNLRTVTGLPPRGMPRLSGPRGGKNR